MNFFIFLKSILHSPSLCIVFLLTLGVIFVNGSTDAPNAIATCIATKAITPKKAIFMSAIFNLLGIFVMTYINSSVAFTIKNVVDFQSNSKYSLIALCAALFSIIFWAVSAWYFGIPTSESHALVAGLSGAGVALSGNFSCININAWIHILVGLFASSLGGFLLGYLSNTIIVGIFKNINRQKTSYLFDKIQELSSYALSFMHGAQDGQKFLGVMLLGLSFFIEHQESSMVVIPNWMIILCALSMSIGTSVGGLKIIKSVGLDMAKLEKHQGFCADLTSTLCLLFSSLLGLPVSTTHTKTCAIMGVGLSRGRNFVNFSVIKEMLVAWTLTFPACASIGYAFAKILLYFIR